MTPPTNPYSATDQGAPPLPPPTPGNWIAAAVTATLTIALFVGIVWYQRVRESRPQVEAIVQLRREPPTVLPSALPTDVEQYERFRTTQSNLITTHRVATDALRDPGIASLSAVRGQADPIQWLSEAIVVEAPINSEYLRIRLDPAAVGDVDQEVAIVNALVNAYVDSANSQERRRRVTRLDQLRIGVTELEDALRQRRREQQELQQVSSAPSVELDSLTLKIANQQQILDELQRELARTEIEEQAPARVKLVQEARAPEKE